LPAAGAIGSAFGCGAGGASRFTPDPGALAPSFDFAPGFDLEPAVDFEPAVDLEPAFGFEPGAGLARGARFGAAFALPFGFPACFE
jgi:hypothetical protein